MPNSMFGAEPWLLMRLDRSSGWWRWRVSGHTRIRSSWRTETDEIFRNIEIRRYCGQMRGADAAIGAAKPRQRHGRAGKSAQSGKQCTFRTAGQRGDVNDMPGGAQPVDMPTHRIPALEVAGNARPRPACAVGAAAINIAPGNKNGRAQRAGECSDVERQFPLQVYRQYVGARFGAERIKGR